jgi:hypothetical protein
MLSLQFTQVRYSYARDRAVGFSEFWRPLKWSEAEWERRYLAFLSFYRFLFMIVFFPNEKSRTWNRKNKYCVFFWLPSLSKSK